MDVRQFDQIVDLKSKDIPNDAIYGSLGDRGAHVWNVTIFKGSTPADLAGAAVTADFLRMGDRVTVTIAGTITGNVASVVTTQECYAVAGEVRGSLRVTKDGATITEAHCTLHVAHDSTTAVVTPGTLNTTLAGVYASESARVTAENGRVSAEAARVTAENARVTAENARSLFATNMFDNGDFEADPLGLTIFNGSVAAATDRMRSGSRSIKLVSTGAGGLCGKTITMVAGHVMYASAWYYVDGATAGRIVLQAGNAYGFFTPDIGVWKHISITAVNANTGGAANTAFIGTPDNNAMTLYMDCVMVLDLTAIFGAGHEPTAAMMDAYLAYWDNYYFGGTVNLGQAEKAVKAILSHEARLSLAESGLASANGIVAGHTSQLAEIDTITPVASMTYTGNPEYVITGVNVDTNTFSCPGHGMANGDIVFPTPNLNAGNVYPISVYPGGLVQRHYYVINVTTDTFQLSQTSGGSAIDVTTNAGLDFSKWHFEKGLVNGIQLSNLPARRRYRAKFSGKFAGSIGNFYCNPNQSAWRSGWLIIQNIYGAGQSATAAALWGIYDSLFSAGNGVGEWTINQTAWNPNTDTANKFDARTITQVAFKLLPDITSMQVSLGGSYIANGSMLEVYKA